VSVTSCCICDPSLPISPHVCERHKREGRTLATQLGCLFRDAAADLYFEARRTMQEGASL
jgi:hypothetical protein